MAASPEGKPHGVVVIVLPDGGGRHDRTSFAGEEEAVAFLDSGATDWSEEEERRPRAALSLRRAAGAVLALAALAVAGYFCLYAGADAAWRFLLAPEEASGGGQGASSFVLPLYAKERNSTAAVRGNAFQDRQYYTTISIGNPPRPYFLDVDTGSDLTWIQCDAPCSNCAKGPHPLYKPAQENIIRRSDSSCLEVQGNPSDTSKQCDYDIVYADQSSSLGVLARDHMQLITEDGERENLDVVFGCSYDQQGDLLSSLETTDGILGLSSASISLPAQLASQGIISNVFGHCIAADPSVGGYLFLGDDYVPKWGMTWVPIRNGPGNAYSAEVHRLIQGDQQLGVRGQAGKVARVIFDSGSTYTYLPHEAYTDLIAALKDASPRFIQDYSDKTLPFCMKADFPVRSVDDVKQLFKPLSLQFKNRLFIFPRTFTIRPEDYLILSDKGNVCLGVLDGTEIGYGSAIVLGDLSLRGKLVAYDNDKNHIGWALSNCSRPHEQSRIPFFLRRALPNQLL
ncbi:hypothetical protein EJB05_45302 [Eragrostis curvula]|uniref:Peptidase A1 domain-containing protein n=1 Tax=Eragrostis curvula TaxID=38414 RepID=A0A5J9TJZ8_9POAL|nr:hypothetical protein EJB05_45302 [Eragrostis curvula]